MKLQDNLELEYSPSLTYGTAVRVIRKGHPKSGQTCVVMTVLANPSKRPDNQWYDVRFADSSWGRFPGSDLERTK